MDQSNGSIDIGVDIIIDINDTDIINDIGGHIVTLLDTNIDTNRSKIMISQKFPDKEQI